MKNQIDDSYLVSKIQKNQCSDSILKLRDRHVGLVMSIYGKYSNILSKLHFIPNEFNDEINNIIFDSAKKFDLKRENIKFSTWLGEQTKYYCLNKINELNKNKSINSDPDTITRIMDECCSSESINNTKNVELCEYIFSILDQIQDKRVKEIFMLRYFNGYKNKMTWKEIADKVGCTSQTCINLFDKNIRLIRKKLESLEIFDRI